MNRQSRSRQQPGARRWLAGWLKLWPVCISLALLVACQFPFSPTPLPPLSGSNAEIELVAGRGQAKPAGGEGWTEFHVRFSLLFGDQIRVPEEETSPTELRLADGTTLRLDPGTVLQLVEPPPPETRPVFRLVEGRIAANLASSDQLFDIYVSVPASFTYNTLNFVVDSQQTGTAFQLWLDEATAHIVVGTEGLVRVTTDEDEAILEPEWQAWAEIDGEIQTIEPRPPDTPTPTVTATPTATHSPTPTLTATPSPTASPTPTATLTPTPTKVRETPTPVATSTPTVRATAALPHLYEAPTLLEPHANQVFGFDQQQSINLVWTPVSLAEDHWYEVQLWQEDEQPKGHYWTKENWWDMGPEYYPGDYYWRVVIVQGKEEHVVGAISPPSETRYFQWVAVGPAPTPGSKPDKPSKPKPTDPPQPKPTDPPQPKPTKERPTASP